MEAGARLGRQTAVATGVTVRGRVVRCHRESREGDMDSDFFRPVSGVDLPRFAGIPTFMRLPHVALDDPRIAEVQVGLIGAPWDGGTTNRPGPRHGPRQLRDLSTMIRAQNGVTEGAPVRAGALRRPGRRGTEPRRPDGFAGADGGILCPGEGQGHRAADRGGRSSVHAADPAGAGARMRRWA